MRSRSDTLTADHRQLLREHDALSEKLRKTTQRYDKLSGEMQRTTAKMLDDEQVVAELEHQLSMAKVAVSDLSTRCEHLIRENEDLQASNQSRSRGEALAAAAGCGAGRCGIHGFGWFASAPRR